MRHPIRALGTALVFTIALTLIARFGAADASGPADLGDGGASFAQIPTSLPPPAPTPRPTEISDAKACRRIASRVPASAIDAALANPNAVGGYNRLRDENKPASPMNPRQVYLSLLNPSVPYHPLFNPLHFRAGCP